MKKILTAVSTIEDVLNKQCVYVDKTAYLYELVTSLDRLFFISRPRRFGKSLMISTLKAIFEGRRELFEGLAISTMDYDWKPYPVLHFDLSKIRDRSVEDMNRVLIQKVQEVAESLDLPLTEEKSSGIAFEQLWSGIQKRNLRVVVLIDEYDVPMQGFLNRPELLEQVRVMLHDFYIRLKIYSSNIRFLMMTGVSKFAKLSVFSGLNNLVDLSLNVPFAGMLGYTEEELDTYFREHIQAFADAQNVSYDEMRTTLRQWYDGYHFSRDLTVGVYNPVSIGLALTKRELDDYWIQTGGASLIMERLREAKKIPADLTEIPYTTSGLESCDTTTMPLESLLYQSGYLTIQKVVTTRSILLGIPNREVRSALTFQYLQGAIPSGSEAFRARHDEACEALFQGNLEYAIKLFRSSVAALPYTWLMHDEGAAKIAFLSFFYPMSSVRISTEEEIASGKIDAVIETSHGVYIFEFKYNQSAQIAHDQVLEKGYAEPYRACGKPIYAIGLNYTPDGEKRGIDEAIVSQVE